MRQCAQDHSVYALGACITGEQTQCLAAEFLIGQSQRTKRSRSGKCSSIDDSVSGNIYIDDIGIFRSTLAAVSAIGIVVDVTLMPRISVVSLSRPILS